MPQGSFSDVTSAGAAMNELWSGIQGSLGALPTTQAGWSDHFTADPLTKSIMLDYEQEFAKKQAQSMEDMKRLGVIRAGDTQRALSNLQESDARTRAGIQSDSAARAQANYESALASGIDLSGLMERRELGIADLTGMYGDTPTLGGLQHDLDLMASAIAAGQAGYDPLAKAILGGMQFMPETKERELAGGLTAETRYRDMVRDSAFKTEDGEIRYSAGGSSLSQDEMAELADLQLRISDGRGQNNTQEDRYKELLERFYGTGGGAEASFEGYNPMDYRSLTGDKAVFDEWWLGLGEDYLSRQLNPEWQSLVRDLQGLGFTGTRGGPDWLRGKWGEGGYWGHSE